MIRMLDIEEEKKIKNTIKKIGENKGIEKGIKKGKVEIVKNMLEKKTDINFIKEVTGFSEEQTIDLM